MSRRDLDSPDHAAELAAVRAEYETFRYRLPDAMVEAEVPAGGVTYLNWMAENTLGYTHEDVAAGIDGYMLVDDASRAILLDNLAKTLGGSTDIGKPYTPIAAQELFEVNMVRKDGTAFPAEVQGAYVLDERGFPVRLRVLFRDITERRRAEQALRESEERLEAALRGADLTLWDFDVASRRLSIAHGSSLGPPGDARGWMPRVHPDDIERVRGALNGHIAGQSRSFEEEFRLQRADGSWAWVLGRGTVVEWTAGGQPARVGGSILDITRLRDAEHERERVEQLMRETQRLETVGTLAAGVAHDFNNLLTAISGNLFLLRDYVPDSHPAVELVAEASIAAERGADLVRRLLAFGRPGGARRDDVDLSALVAETLRLSRVEENAAYEVSLTDDAAPALVRGDETLLQQVILNLVINAVDAMPAGGRLAVAIAAEDVPQTGRLTAAGLAPGRYVTVSVSDSGPGIARGDVGKVFDPFFTTKEVGKGTGLGLWTSLHIARGHQGWIDIAETSEQGTTFKLYLPRRNA